MRRPDPRTLVRSGFARAPRLFDIASGPLRFEVLSRLGMVAEADFRALPRLTDRSDPLVLDIGANVGQSLLSIKTVLPAARVVCFEPNAELHPTLRRLAAKQRDVRLEPVGLGAADDEQPLYTPVYNRHAMPGLSSFDRAAAAGWLNSSTLYGFRPERLLITESVAVIRRLDDFELAPDIVKIDVQGMEPDVVRGGLETFRRHLPAVIAETIRRASETYALLEPLGYVLTEWDGKRLVPATERRLNQILVPASHPAAPPS